MAWDHTKSRQARGYWRHWEKLRQDVLERDDGLCQVCLSRRHVTAATEVDHIVPKAKGGDDEPENPQAICRECHRTKTAQETGKRRRIKGCSEDGTPLDPDHPWHREEVR